LIKFKSRKVLRLLLRGTELAAHKLTPDFDGAFIANLICFKREQRHVNPLLTPTFFSEVDASCTGGCGYSSVDVHINGTAAGN
jgi:hypothetical protein